MDLGAKLQLCPFLEKKMKSATWVVKSVKVIAAACILLSAGGCATPSQAPNIDVAKEQVRLKQTMKGSNAFLAIKCAGYDINRQRYDDLCVPLDKVSPLQKSVAAWATLVDNPERLQPGDVQIRANWSIRDIYTDSSGATAAAALFSLGLVPSIDKMEMQLDIEVVRGGKAVFSQRFIRADEGNNNLWTRDADKLKLTDRIATRIVNDFIRELEGSEGLEQ